MRKAAGGRPAFTRVEADIHAGLSPEQVRLRIGAGAANDAPKGVTPSISHIVSHNVFTLFNCINLILALLVVWVGHAKNALFFFVAVINTLMGVIQELRAKRTLDRLAILAEAPATVVRGGAKEQIPQGGVVLDDILFISAGEQVCADATVLESNGLEADESLLTGESVNVGKAAGQPLLSGSFITAGSANARVTAVGELSYAHSLAAEAKKHKKPQTKMMRTFNRIIRTLTFVIMPIGALLYIKNMGAGAPAAVLGSAAAMIGMIPEGLILLTGVTLTLGALRLARVSALVQTLPGIETLARTDVICLDKTGTITDGALELYDVIPTGAYGKDEARRALRETLCALSENNAVSNAVLAALGRDALWRAEETAPFSSERKWSGARFADKGWYILGAPGFVLPDGGGAAPWDEIEALARDGKRVLCLAHAAAEARAEGPIEMQAESAKRDGEKNNAQNDSADNTQNGASNGKHVALTGGSQNRTNLSDGQTNPQVGFVSLPAGRAELPAGLVCAAIVVLSDSLRNEAAETVRFFADEGVEIKVISGDDPLTVSSVARKAGVDGAERHIDMSRAGGADDRQYDALAAGYTVFGRASPAQKRELVRAMKRAGRTVCMTGDGVNDVLAMKEADCSVAMRAGSGAARGVSDFVLMESDFKAMRDVLYEGRRVINNIETVSALYLIKTIYSAILSVLYIFMPAPYPFAPLQVTPINMFTVGIPSFFVALRRQFRKPAGRFGANILEYSLPAALTIAINIIAVHAISRRVGISPEEAGAMRILLTGAAGFYALYAITRPVGKELYLYFAYIGAFVFILFMFAPFFGIDWLEPRDAALLIPSLALIPALFGLVRRAAVRVAERRGAAVK